MPKPRKRGEYGLKIPAELMELIDRAVKGGYGYSHPREFIFAAIRDKLKALGLLPKEA